MNTTSLALAVRRGFAQTFRRPLQVGVRYSHQPAKAAFLMGQRGADASADQLHVGEGELDCLVMLTVALCFPIGHAHPACLSFTSMVSGTAVVCLRSICQFYTEMLKVTPEVPFFKKK